MFFMLRPLSRNQRHYPPHHCDSHGTPSRSPSISTPGQFLRKKVASAQECICEQCVRPSQENLEAVSSERESEAGTEVSLKEWWGLADE
jgi:hypothetical protein